MNYWFYLRFYPIFISFSCMQLFLFVSPLPLWNQCLFSVILRKYFSLVFVLMAGQAIVFHCKYYISFCFADKSRIQSVAAQPKSNDKWVSFRSWRALIHGWWMCVYLEFRALKLLIMKISTKFIICIICLVTFDLIWNYFGWRFTWK